MSGIVSLSSAKPDFAPLLTAATSVAAGSACNGRNARKSYQASGTTTSGTGSASINVEGSLDGSNWDVIGTITLTLGTSSTSDSFASDDRYTLVRGNVTAISGTGASVNLSMGY
jgi:hypothetical protein